MRTVTRHEEQRSGTQRVINKDDGGENISLRGARDGENSENVVRTEKELCKRGYVEKRTIQENRTETDRDE